MKTEALLNIAEQPLLFLKKNILKIQKKIKEGKYEKVERFL